MNPQTLLTHRFAAAMSDLPLVAILRGVRPDEAVDLGTSLYESGFRLIEVPLNSPNPMDSISALRRALPEDALVGAGTVRSVSQIEQLVGSGGELVVMPHADSSLIRAVKSAGLLCVPGIVTPTEAFAALDAGADALKIFPADLVTPAILKAIRVVLPNETRLLPVGAITPHNMQAYFDAGADGFGLGSALFKPGMTVQQTGDNARAFVAAWRAM
jgi:2-dehydro-3-deoxyphosphogalactonate aldolase